MRNPKPTVIRYWKVLDAAGHSCHGGDFTWSLPTWSKTKGWIPGDWTPNVTPRLCESGYHVCRDDDLIHWLGERIYACEVRGEVDEADDKVVAESVRLLCPTPWDDVSARLFTAECAAEVLPLYEARYPNDSRVSDCLETSFRYALGDASEPERAAAYLAAHSAADAAADAAASLAAGLAAHSAQTARLLWWIGASDA